MERKEATFTREKTGLSGDELGLVNYLFSPEFIPEDGEEYSGGKVPVSSVKNIMRDAIKNHYAVTFPRSDVELCQAWLKAAEELGHKEVV